MILETFIVFVDFGIAFAVGGENLTEKYFK